MLRLHALLFILESLLNVYKKQGIKIIHDLNNLYPLQSIFLNLLI